MTVYREQIAQRIKGSLAEREDWWTLLYDSETGTFQVEHEWDHMNPYKLGEGDSSRGKSYHPAETWDGEGTSSIEAAKTRLLAKARA